MPSSLIRYISKASTKVVRSKTAIGNGNKIPGAFSENRKDFLEEIKIIINLCLIFLKQGNLTNPRAIAALFWQMP